MSTPAIEISREKWMSFQVCQLMRAIFFFLPFRHSIHYYYGWGKSGTDIAEFISKYEVSKYSAEGTLGAIFIMNYNKLKKMCNNIAELNMYCLVLINIAMQRRWYTVFITW